MHVKRIPVQLPYVDFVRARSHTVDFNALQVPCTVPLSPCSEAVPPVEAAGEASGKEQRVRLEVLLGHARAQSPPIHT